MNDKLQDAINDSLVYLAEHANEYLEEDSIRRIIMNAARDNEDADLYLGEAVYEVIRGMDSSCEQEYGFISGVKYANNILNNN